MSFQWAEDDALPSGVVRVDCEGPKDGKTYVMYHGTKRANVSLIRASGFHQSSTGMLGRGVYLSRDLKKASCYPIDHPEHDRVVIKVQVNVGKVKAIDRQDHPLQKTWHEEGYDTAWVPPGCGMVPSGLEENCVWDPKRITVLDTIEPKLVRDTGTGSRPIYSLPDCGGAGRGGAGRGRAGRGGSGRGRAGRGGAGRGRAGRGGAGRGGAGRGRAGRDRAGRGRAGRDRAGRGGAGHKD